MPSLSGQLNGSSSIGDSSSRMQPAQRVSSGLQNSMNELGDAFRRSNSANLVAFQSHTSDILTGSGGVKESMDSLDKRMADWEKATNQELVQCRNTAANMTAQV